MGPRDKGQKYYIIYNSDGDTTVEETTGDKLFEKLEEEYDLGNEVGLEFLNKIKDSDTNYWKDNQILIIKGKIFVPKAINDID